MKNSSGVMIALVVCLALLLSQEAHSWRPRHFAPKPPLLTKEQLETCKAARDYETKQKPCIDEVAAEIRKFREGDKSKHLSMGPACCAFELGVFDSCVRPKIPTSLLKTTDYPPRLTHLCKS